MLQKVLGTADDLKFTAANGSGVSMLGRAEFVIFSCACGTMMRIKMFGRKPD